MRRQHSRFHDIAADQREIIGAESPDRPGSASQPPPGDSAASGHIAGRGLAGVSYSLVYRGVTARELPTRRHESDVITVARRDIQQLALQAK